MPLYISLFACVDGTKVSHQKSHSIIGLYNREINNSDKKLDFTQQNTKPTIQMANYSNIGLSAITKPTQEINDAGEKKTLRLQELRKLSD